ncbi:MAG: response regulator [Nitrospinales bacterium]
MSEPKPGPFKILLVDDTPMNLVLETKMLSRKGHDVFAVESGREALAAFQEDRFDVVLMDMRMPGMDGLETTRKIRELESANNTAAVPIIAMTANDMESDKQKCLEAGMDGFISKPLAIREVLSHIEEIVAAKRSKTR